MSNTGGKIYNPHYVYRYFDNEKYLLYVGLSADAVKRMAAHAEDKDWFGQVRSVTIQEFRNRPSAEAAEYNAIQDEFPIFNKQHVLGSNYQKPHYCLFCKEVMLYDQFYFRYSDAADLYQWWNKKYPEAGVKLMVFPGPGDKEYDIYKYKMQDIIDAGYSNGYLTESNYNCRISEKGGPFILTPADKIIKNFKFSPKRLPNLSKSNR